MVFCYMIILRYIPPVLVNKSNIINLMLKMEKIEEDERDEYDDQASLEDEM